MLCYIGACVSGRKHLIGNSETGKENAEILTVMFNLMFDSTVSRAAVQPQTVCFSPLSL